jgi:hypothetical protein
MLDANVHFGSAVPERPQPNRLTKPAALPTSSLSPNSSSNKPPLSQHRRPVSYHAPPGPPRQPSEGLSFPEPQSNTQSFYSGVTYPSDPSVMHNTSFTSAPLRHPSTAQRPQSYYGLDPHISAPYSGYGFGYPKP